MIQSGRYFVYHLEKYTEGNTFFSVYATLWLHSSLSIIQLSSSVPPHPLTPSKAREPPHHQQEEVGFLEHTQIKTTISEGTTSQADEAPTPPRSWEKGVGQEKASVKESLGGIIGIDCLVALKHASKSFALRSYLDGKSYPWKLKCSINIRSEGTSGSIHEPLMIFSNSSISLGAVVRFS